MKWLLTVGLLMAGSASGSFCELLVKPEIAFVGKVGRWSVVVETVVKGPVHPQVEYKLARPMGSRFGERYLIFADLQHPDNVLNVREAWDVKYWDPRTIEALRESASGRGPRLFGDVRFDDRKPAGGLVPVHATGPNGIERKTFTKPGGFFEFQNIPPGEYKPTLGEASLDDPSAPVAHVPVGALVPATGCAMVAIAAAPNGWIEGVVRDVTGLPVPNARVRAYTTGRTNEATADTAGRYRLRGLPKDRYRVTHDTSSVTIDLKDREGRAGVDLRTPPRIEYAELIIEIFDAAGQTVKGAEVFLYSPRPAPVRTFLPSGNTLSVRLPQGELYSVAARLWRDGGQRTGSTGSLRLESTGAKVRLILK